MHGPKVRDGNNPITPLRSVKNRSCATSTGCWSDNSGGFSRTRCASAASPAKHFCNCSKPASTTSVFRLGLANTRSGARQLVSHGHVLVNGRTVNISSYNVKAGDEVSVKDKPKTRQLALRNLELTQIVPVPDWLTVDRDALKGKSSPHPFAGRDSTDG